MKSLLRKTQRRCHFCEGAIPDDEKAVKAKTGNAWAHFECWYDGAPPAAVIDERWEIVSEALTVRR